MRQCRGLILGASLGIGVVIVTLAFAPGRAAAHPLGAASINRYARLDAYSDGFTLL
jgi:hypothetical protein